MQLDLGVTSGMQQTKILGLSKVAQKTHIENVWVGDDIIGAHEAFTVVSSMLLKHKNINASIGVTSPLIRNISTIARASITLAQIGGDKRRFRLGLGIGGLQDLSKLGITLGNPVGILRDATTLVRKIWNNEAINFESEDFKFSHYHSSIKADHVPIFFGVRGPKLLALAAEIAEGIILSGPKTYLKKAVSMVRNSITKSGRSLKDFTFVVWVPTMVTEKPSDLRLAKQTAAFVLCDTPRNVLEMGELDSAGVETLKKTYRRHGIGSAAKLVDEALLNEVAVHGDVRQICEDFQAFEKMRVQEVVFGPPYGAKPHVALAAVADEWRSDQ